MNIYVWCVEMRINTVLHVTVHSVFNNVYNKAGIKQHKFIHTLRLFVTPLELDDSEWVRMD